MQNAADRQSYSHQRSGGCLLMSVEVHNIFHTSRKTTER